MLRVGVVGCGFIGSVICRAIDTDLEDIELVAVHEHHTELVHSLCETLTCRPKLMKIRQMVKIVDLLVEAAAPEAVPQAAIPALENGCDVMIMSVGALVDGELFDRLKSLARENKCRVYLPSGAVVLPVENIVSTISISSYEHVNVILIV